MPEFIRDIVGFTALIILSCLAATSGAFALVYTFPHGWPIFGFVVAAASLVAGTRVVAWITRCHY